MNMLKNEPQAWVYIRYSSLAQATGDSENRQLSPLEAFTAEKNIPIPEDHIFFERAVSAFRGQHAKKGQLSILIDMVDRGIIKDGDWIVCESIDRLSRERLFVSHERIIGWLKKGIKLYTTIDRQTYELNKDSEDADLTTSLKIQIIATRAREESLTKSRRVKAAWNSRVEQAKDGKIIITKGKSIPFGLRYDANINQFVRDEEECFEVEKLFMLMLERGILESLKEINKTSKRLWQNGHIQKMLSSKYVIGYYTRHKIIYEQGKKDKNDTVSKKQWIDEIPNYYPNIITHELFYAVVRKLKERKNGNQVGRLSERNYNIFQHVIYCDVCKSPMFYDHRGASYQDKIYPHFKCKSKTTGEVCTNHRIRFEYCFKGLLNYFHGLKLLDEASKNRHVTGKDDVEITEKRKKISEFLDHKPETTTRVLGDITSLVSEKRIHDKFREELQVAENKYNKALSDYENARNSFDNIVKAGYAISVEVNQYLNTTKEAKDQALLAYEEARSKIIFNDSLESFYVTKIVELYKTEEGRIKLNNFFKGNGIKFLVKHNKEDRILTFDVRQKVGNKTMKVGSYFMKTGKPKNKRIRGKKPAEFNILADFAYTNEQGVMEKITFNLQEILNENVHVSPNQKVERRISGKTRRAFTLNNETEKVGLAGVKEESRAKT